MVSALERLALGGRQMKDGLQRKRGEQAGADGRGTDADVECPASDGRLPS